jgi:alkylated DNA nucleotide flippase Atl1
MFYLPLAAITWGWFALTADRRRLPGLVRYGLFGGVLATIQDRLVMLYRLWEYQDVGRIDTHAEIALLISLSAAPVAAMRFAQGLHPGAPMPWWRVARYTAVAMLPEIVGLYAGKIRYDHGWTVWWSLIAYLPIWLSLWGLHRWSHRRAQPRSA